MIRAASLSIGILALVLAAGVAHAQEVEIPGARIVAEGAVGPLGPGPALPVDDVPVVTEPVPFRIGGGETDPLQSCTIDDSLVNEVTGEDTVPCRVERVVNVTEPCETVLETVAFTPFVGGAFSEAVTGTGESVDGAVDGAAPSIGWGGTTGEFARSCDADVASLGGRVLQRPSEVVIELTLEIPVCPGFGVPVCESVSQRQAEDQVFDENRVPLATSSCEVTDFKADCGAIEVADTQVDAFPETHAVADALYPHAYREVDTEDGLARETPGVSPFAVTGNSGSAACTVGGIPDDPGILPGSWGARLTAEPNGALPAGLHGPLLDVLQTAFGVFNEMTAELSDTTSSTLLTTIAAVNAAWETPLVHDTLHPEHDGSAGHTGCDGAAPPSATLEAAPGVYGLPAPGGDA